ncbi:hypothetical protein MKW94_011423 [Papaver nudicaule]|uniref:Transmembrane protein n=1 Tax=Papaver nudicaule TaxID=74823 RepID=A0AA41SCE6_PAPNU|nr:hypothetical protein [Papaver nudicaule]
MGCSYFLGFLIFSAVLVDLCSSQGVGRKLMTLEINEEGSGVVLLEARKMAEVMDYTDPEANKNPRSGSYLFTTSPLSPLPPPPYYDPPRHRHHD